MFNECGHSVEENATIKLLIFLPTPLTLNINSLMLHAFSFFLPHQNLPGLVLDFQVL